VRQDQGAGLLLEVELPGVPDLRDRVVVQEAPARPLARQRAKVRRLAAGRPIPGDADTLDVDGQEIARLGALHVDRSHHRVRLVQHGARRLLLHLLRQGAARRVLPPGVPRLGDHRVVGRHVQGRLVRPESIPVARRDEMMGGHSVASPGGAGRPREAARVARALRLRRGRRGPSPARVPSGRGGRSRARG